MEKEFADTPPSSKGLEDDLWELAQRGCFCGAKMSFGEKPVRILYSSLEVIREEKYLHSDIDH